MIFHHNRPVGGEDRPRRSAGTPAGGQFASKQHGESGVSLTGPIGDTNTDKEVEMAVESTSPDSLQRFVDSPTEIVRCAVARNKNLTDDQVVALSGHEQSHRVRIAAASQRREACAILVATDPDPFVRAFALPGRNVGPSVPMRSLADEQADRIRTLAAGGLDLDKARKMSISS